MTPYSLAFYVNAVTTGTVLGLRPTDAPERVTEVLGPRFGDNDFGTSMVRDYGLAEFYWHRSRSADPWVGHHFTLQVHRLSRGDRSSVNERLREQYGRFTHRLRFEKLRRLLERRGVSLVEVPDPGNAPYYRTFWQPDSQVAVSVIAGYGQYSTPDHMRVGDVYSILAPMTAAEVEWRRASAA
ncbi:hypothetical protein ACFXPM_12235 [Streptomyces sp. NPDC059095]|uniref:hypothetical protein n=1 Tax=unclassified Streptomyces TaxID=2593676 RepID=UPI000C270AE2|nr:hypothetical protein [Streptomyces sp. CB01201]PJN05124.1 hypothetical protein CG740_04555 [Streptomyces sp. CB01201]